MSFEHYVADLTPERTVSMSVSVLSMQHRVRSIHPKSFFSSFDFSPLFFTASNFLDRFFSFFPLSSSHHHQEISSTYTTLLS